MADLVMRVTVNYQTFFGEGFKGMEQEIPIRTNRPPIFNFPKDNKDSTKALQERVLDFTEISVRTPFELPIHRGDEIVIEGMSSVSEAGYDITAIHLLKGRENNRANIGATFYIRGSSGQMLAYATPATDEELERLGVNPPYRKD